MALFDKLKGMAKEAAEKAKDLANQAVQAQQQKAQQEEQAKKDENAAKIQSLIDYLVNVTDEEKYIGGKSYMSTTVEYDRKKREFDQLATREDRAQLEARMAEKERLAVEAEKNAVQTAIEAKLAEMAAEIECEYGKGNCFWFEKKFYCTCGDEECPKKKYIPADQRDELISAEHLPYAKLMGKFYSSDFTRDEYYRGEMGFTRKELLRHFFDKFLPNSHPIPEEDEDGEYEETGYVDLLPNADMDCVPIMATCIGLGLGKQNPIMRILFDYYEKTGNRMPHAAEVLELLTEWKVDTNQDFFKNPSLYDRSAWNFMYAALALDAAVDPDNFDHPEKVDISLLYNPDGTIKETGFGGPQNGHYGDVIYNIVGEWGSNIGFTLEYAQNKQLERIKSML